MHCEYSNATCECNLFRLGKGERRGERRGYKYTRELSQAAG